MMLTTLFYISDIANLDESELNALLDRLNTASAVHEDDDVAPVPASPHESEEVLDQHSEN